MNAILNFLQRFALLFTVWLILTANAPSAWGVGLLVAIGAALLSRRLLPPARDGVRALALLALLPGFLWGSFRGGVDVARRAFNPRLPLQPGWIRYPLRLQGSTARVSLGNMLSLMPGTLGAGCAGDVLLVHCLDGDLAGSSTIALEEDRIARSLGILLEPANG